MPVSDNVENTLSESSLSMKCLDLEILLADRESVRSILESLGDDDPVGRLSFSARLASIEEQIQRVTAVHDVLGITQKNRLRTGRNEPITRPPEKNQWRALLCRFG